jgi:prolyl-tRNA synthetase
MSAKVLGPDGQEHAVHMGSYGIGPSRLAAAVIEASHDEAGIIWPDAVAPFDVALLNLKSGDGGTDAAAAGLDAALTAAGLDVLHDDRDERPGRKVRHRRPSRHSLAGPGRPAGLAEGKVELKRRATGEREMLPLADVPARLRST